MYYPNRATEIAAFAILLHVNSEDARNPVLPRADRKLIAGIAQINRRVLRSLGAVA